jgi:hypothetical protein
LNLNETELKQLIENAVARYVKQYAENFTAELRNENGNSTVKQSGNGIVYVDNTGIAYAMILFYFHFMPEEYREKMNIDVLFKRLDGIMGENRKIFTETIQSLQDNE